MASPAPPAPSVTGFGVYSILNPPSIAVTLSIFVTDVTNVQADYNYGEVNAINYFCNIADVGDTVLFKKTDANILTMGGTDYYVVDENSVLLTQIPTTPLP